MIQGIINGITVLAFIIAIFTWFDIKPKRLQDITKKYLLRDWYIALAVVVTCVDVILIFFMVRGGTHHWWSYTESSWSLVYIWLVSILYFKKERDYPILMIFILIAPVMFIFTSSGRVYDAFSTGAVAVLPLSNDRLVALGICVFYLLLFGFNLGMGIFL
jgi:hypothetical protein